MYGEKEVSFAPRLSIVAFHFVILAFSGWVMFAGGFELIGAIFGSDWQYGTLERRILLFAISLIGFGSFCFKAFVTFKRRLRWNELPGIMNAIVVYYTAFTLLGAGNSAPVGIFEAVAFVVFLSGIGLTAGSELQRMKFRAQPGFAQTLYTKGLFGFVRHPNYLGDIIFVTGWALATGVSWALLAPLWLFAMINILFVPQLSKYLQNRYPEDYAAWKDTTPALIPGLKWH